MKSWKTTIAGILAVLPILAHAIWPTVITETIAVEITGVFVSLGLIAAKDGNVTGGTVDSGKTPPPTIDPVQPPK